MCCQVARTLLDYGLPFEVQSFSGCVFGEGEWLKMVSGKVLLLKIEWMLFFKNELWYVVHVVT